MARPLLLCPRCGQPFALGARYCARCGEPVDAQLVAQLQSLYTTLTDLDARIAEGKGAETITSLRDEYRAQYLALRKATPAASAATATPTTVPHWPAPPIPAAAPVGAAPVPQAPVSTPVAAPLPQPAPPSGAQPTRQPGPAFSWQAFIAEQAIAIMAYLGGFLLLVATLTFEVGGWQVLPIIARLGVVVVQYLDAIVAHRFHRLRHLGMLKFCGHAE